MSDRKLTRRQFVAGSMAAPLAVGTGAGCHAAGKRRQSYCIESIQLYTRVTPPARMDFAIGKQHGPRAQPLSNPIGHVRMVVRDSSGARTFGCSGDRLSVRWLDKRPGRGRHLKLCELVDLIEYARGVYLAQPQFDNPFDKWLSCYHQILKAGRGAGQVDLTSAFASSLMERAMLDAVCRLAGKPIFQMVRQDRLGVRPAQVHPELEGLSPEDYVPLEPVRRFHIRHAVGLTDPLTDEDLPADQRLNDGLPETLAEYVEVDGLTHFKIKIAGDVEGDLKRLERVWGVLPKRPDTLVTMDANEMLYELDGFEQFVGRLRRELPELFEHIAWIEQPVPRALSLDPATAPAIRRISALKPITIDEADGTLDAFKRAQRIGYSGTSHKNCKGFFKSLLNRALIEYYNARGENTFITGEDLTCLPIVPLHEDFTAQSILGITHCDRNGHHYHYGLSSLSPKEKAQIARHHRSMYVYRNGEWFLDIRDGQVDCSSLQCPGFGVAEEPDWDSMQDMRTWLQTRDSSA